MSAQPLRQQLKCVLGGPSFSHILSYGIGVFAGVKKTGSSGRTEVTLSTEAKLLGSGGGGKGHKGGL